MSPPSNRSCYCGRTIRSDTSVCDNCKPSTIIQQPLHSMSYQRNISAYQNSQPSNSRPTELPTTLYPEIPFGITGGSNYRKRRSGGSPPEEDPTKRFKPSNFHPSFPPNMIQYPNTKPIGNSSAATQSLYTVTPSPSTNIKPMGASGNQVTTMNLGFQRGNPFINCSECEKCSSRKDLIKHYITGHNKDAISCFLNVKSEDIIGPDICFECGEILSNSDTVRKHHELAHKGMFVTCKDRQGNFYPWEKNKNEYANPNTIQCYKCGKIQGSWPELFKHQKDTHREMFFKCIGCYKLQYQWLIEAHFPGSIVARRERS